MASTTSRPTPNQVLAAKLHVKVSKQLGIDPEPDIKAIAEWKPDDEGHVDAEA